LEYYTFCPGHFSLKWCVIVNLPSQGWLSQLQLIVRSAHNIHIQRNNAYYWLLHFICARRGRLAKTLTSKVRKSRKRSVVSRPNSVSLACNIADVMNISSHSSALRTEYRQCYQHVISFRTFSRSWSVTSCIRRIPTQVEAVTSSVSWWLSIYRKLVQN